MQYNEIWGNVKKLKVHFNFFFFINIFTTPAIFFITFFFVKVVCYSPANNKKFAIVCQHQSNVSNCLFVQQRPVKTSENQLFECSNPRLFSWASATHSVN